MARSPSEIPVEIYNKLKEIAKASDTPVKSLAISIFVYAVKQFLKVKIFSCPVQNHHVYGSLFMYGPAVVLFFLSLLISESFWKITTGSFCCKRIIWSKSRKSIYLAILPPLLWLIIMFADAHYYICAELGPIETAKAATNSSSALEAVKVKYSNARTHSQIIAWSLLLSLMGVATIVLTIDRCSSKLGSKIIRKEDFEEMEAEYAMKLFNERIKPIAEARAKTSVDQLFDFYKGEKPEELVKLAEDYLMAIYPKYDGAGFSCCETFTFEDKGKKVKDLFTKRTNNDGVQVRLTESGQLSKYTSIN